ncbi:hypothetical protein FQJ56_17375 [Escherichia coli]|nr:hypothetical protein [Escherichia coli]
MPTKMRTTRNLLLMATLLGSALFARAAEKEMTIGAIYLDTQGYYALRDPLIISPKRNHV